VGEQPPVGSPGRCAQAVSPPKTLEEYKKVGAALKKKGKPIGQTLGHTFGDAPAWTYPFTWTFGGAETDARTSPRGTRMLGYAGPPTAKATEVYTKYIITDMFAKAAQGTPPADVSRG